jgi:hypothetical protein
MRALSALMRGSRSAGETCGSRLIHGSAHDRKTLRVSVVFMAVLLIVRLAFSAATIQFHLDGDNTVSLLQANDWSWTPQKTFFWGQHYMGTTEVRLFSAVWRAAFGARANIPTLYWVFVGQTLFAAGATLIYAGLLHVDGSLWTKPRTFVLCLLLFGFAAPVFQKYSFGIGHGYSALPLYCGLTVFMYLVRDRLAWGWWLAAGVLLGQSHYIFKLHLVFPVALATAATLAGLRTNATRVGALAIGVVLGMAPETLFTPSPEYNLQLCVGDLNHVVANLRTIYAQSAVHFGTVPDSLIESEHALWFASRLHFADAWTKWGEGAGMILMALLLGIEASRALRSPTYRIFSIIVLVNVAVVAGNCVALDQYTARRYLLPSAFSIVFFMLHQPWTLAQKAAMGARILALALYAVSALMFTTPLSAFKQVSEDVGYDERQDCLVGSGGDLSALLALNGLHSRTVDLDWRLRGNYSRNVPLSEVRDRCRQLFWIDTHRVSVRRIQSLCQPEAPYFSDSARGIARYPQSVSFARCQIQRQPNPEEP